MRPDYVYMYARTQHSFMKTGHMQTGERRQARHICAVCLVHSYVCFACVRRNACNMHVVCTCNVLSPSDRDIDMEIDFDIDIDMEIDI